MTTTEKFWSMFQGQWFVEIQIDVPGREDYKRISTPASRSLADIIREVDAYNFSALNMPTRLQTCVLRMDSVRLFAPLVAVTVPRHLKMSWSPTGRLEGAYENTHFWRLREPLDLRTVANLDRLANLTRRLYRASAEGGSYMVPEKTAELLSIPCPGSSHIITSVEVVTHEGAASDGRGINMPVSRSTAVKVVVAEMSDDTVAFEDLFATVPGPQVDVDPTTSLMESLREGRNRL